MAIVQRAPADKPGEDIVSSIFVSENAKVFRGTQEINYNSTDRVIKTCGLVSHEFVRPGLLASISSNSVVANGKVTDFSVSYELGQLSANITVECVK